MSVQEAFEYGEQMYREGMDLNHIPDHFSAVEKEVCQEAYEHLSATYSLDQLDEDLGQIEQEDNYKELDFH